MARRASRAMVGAIALGASVVAVSDARAAGPPATLEGSFAGATDAFLGYSVAVSGNTVAVGAWNDAGGNGAAYVFVQNGSAWSLQQQLTASDGAFEDQFGYVVALSGDTLLVGAGNRNNGQGAVYAFTRTGSGRHQAQELTSADGVAGDCFGCAIALSGTTAIVGANGRVGSTGGAYIFTQTSSWQLATELAGGAPNDEFGFAVGLSADATTAVAGAFGASNNTGEAHVFTKSGTTWATHQQAILQPSDIQAQASFGYSVAVESGEVLVGAFQSASTSPGAAYVFTGSGTSWSQQTKLVPSDGINGDFFGYSVALSGNSAFVGAPEKAGTTGAAYLFTNAGGSVWTQGEVGAPAAGQSFGYSVALSGPIAAVGAFSADNDSGELYVYGLAAGPPPPPAAPALGGRANVAWLALALGFFGAISSRRAQERA